MLFLYDKKKKVSFNRKVYVVLIPSRSEYSYFGLRENLWYTEEDYRKFTLDSIKLKSQSVSLNA